MDGSDELGVFRGLCERFNVGDGKGVSWFTWEYEKLLKGTRFWKPYVEVRSRYRGRGVDKQTSRLEALRENGLPLPDMCLVASHFVEDASRRRERAAEQDASESKIRLYPRGSFREPEGELTADELFEWVMNHVSVRELLPDEAPSITAWAVLQRFRMNPDFYDRMLEKWLNRKGEDERRKREEQVSGMGRGGRPMKVEGDDGMTLDKLLTTARSRK